MPRSDSVAYGEATPGLILERFDYTRVGEHLAVAQVQAGLGEDRNEPARAELFVRGGRSLRLQFPLQSGRTESRLRPGGSTEQLWRGLFTIPAAFAGRSGIVFELSIDNAEPVILPFPFQRPREPRGLELLPPVDDGPRVGAVQLRQAVAVATAVAVTASSTPAAALANASLSSNHHRAVHDHLSGLASVIHRADAHKPSSSVASRAAAPEKPTRHVAAASSCATSGPEAVIASAGGSACTTHTRGRATAQEGLGPSYSRTRSTKAPKVTRPASSSAGATSPSPGTAATGTTASGSSAAAAAGSSGATVSGSSGATAAGSSGGTATGSSGGVVAGPSGGVAAGTGGALTAPAPVSNSPQPSDQPVSSTPPAAARVKAEPVTHHRPHVISVHAGTGHDGAAPLSGLSAQPPVKLTGVSTTPSAPTLVSTPPGFVGPQSWTGTATNDPALQSALGNLSQELVNADRPPRFLIPIYMEAGRRFHVPWEVLAAINSVESDYGRNLDTSTAGAIGWMQFEPSTWERYGMAVDGHSVANPYDPRDAIFSAAKYLAAAGAAQDLWGAIYAYNHASWYVNMVLTRARAIAAGVRPQNQTLKRGVISVFFAAFSPHHPHRAIRYKGGVLSHYDRLISAANMVSAANFPYVWGGGHEQPARFGPFDCSGSVSYVMQQAGYKVSTTVSGNVPVWKFPAGPGRVTIFYNAVHTFMRIGNRYFGTSGFARPAGGAGWFSTNQIPVSYLDQFSEVHVPHLGVDSFAPRHRRHAT